MTSLRPRRPLVLLLLLLLAAGGCAARTSEPETGGTPDQRRQQIALLDQRIAAAEQELGLRAAPAPPPPGTEAGGAPGQAEVTTDNATPAPEQPPAMTPAQRAPMQAAPPGVADSPMSPRAGGDGGTCWRVCRSVAAICDASARICRLADDLDDVWAAGRCEASTRSCDNAERRARSSCDEC